MNIKLTWLIGITTLLLIISFAVISDEKATSQIRPKLKTAKERLSTKASDQQRVNNCKVPIEQWGDKKRPGNCRKTGSIKKKRQELHRHS